MTKKPDYQRMFTVQFRPWIVVAENGESKQWGWGNPQELSIRLEINTAELARVLGTRAGRSASGKATGLHGIVRAILIARKELAKEASNGKT